MIPARMAWPIAALLATTLLAAPPKLTGVGTAMQEQIAKNEIAGAVSLQVLSLSGNKITGTRTNRLLCLNLTI